MSSQVRAEKVQQQTAPAKQKAATPQVEVPAEQIKYANLLLYCSWTGIGILVVTFLLYMSGIMSSYIPPAEISQYWGMSVHDYLAATGAPHGWAWLGMLGNGDYLNFIGIAFLALLTIVGYLTLLLPAYLRKKDIPYATIAVLEITVLTLAASGILKVGGH
ncbi:hypothetical protein [Desulfoscipio gibsoniae]|uniref:DUF1634 domain-containing protein n=1 Tax=Desulfoscipio gibsoniae DSM 7213 TaxID=767817 RepID=R4KMU1_9FIRM|nr:hypothetical protein [Desulfoscipio gibsoniae]AGL00946.1 hypothetical protein Desgi_1449 [Desulfoscipio gibsoniae DSM 7213]